MYEFVLGTFWFIWPIILAHAQTSKKVERVFSLAGLKCAANGRNVSGCLSLAGRCAEQRTNVTVLLLAELSCAANTRNVSGRISLARKVYCKLYFLSFTWDTELNSTEN